MFSCSPCLNSPICGSLSFCRPPRCHRHLTLTLTIALSCTKAIPASMDFSGHSAICGCGGQRDALETNLCEFSLALHFFATTDSDHSWPRRNGQKRIIYIICHARGKRFFPFEGAGQKIGLCYVSNILKIKNFLALEDAQCYHWLSGYFSASALALAARGIEGLVPTVAACACWSAAPWKPAKSSPLNAARRCASRWRSSWPNCPWHRRTPRCAGPWSCWPG